VTCGVVAVAGASGVVGTAAVEAFSRAGFEVLALSRRPPIVPDDIRFEHMRLDLTDADACRETVALGVDVTHLVYAAVAEADGLIAGWTDPQTIAINRDMFANLAKPLASRGHLRWAGLLQGTKAYGAHVHPVALPARENQPRDPHANFYWEHEDLLRGLADRHSFAFTIFRPQVIFGTAPGAAMNPVAALGAYAALCRELGLPFVCPGNARLIWEVTDASLLAEAMLWACSAASARNQTFNLTNGDVFVLHDAWPHLAEAVGQGTAGTGASGLAEFFSRPEMPLAWAGIARRHGLVVDDLGALLGQSHRYVDLLLDDSVVRAGGLPAMLSSIKIRKTGFGECRDSFDSLLAALKRMSTLNLLPSDLLVPAARQFGSER
jgi:nucleoside-diphosphate-sugar epimerase